MTKTEVVYVEENLLVVKEIITKIKGFVSYEEEVPDLQLTNTLLTEINEYLLLHPV